MGIRRAIAAVGAAVAVLAGTVATGAAPASALGQVRITATVTDQCSAAFYQGDKRLGPEQLPSTGPVGRELWGYRRTGSLDQQQFLATYYDATAGSWKYPPQNGYLLTPNGTPIELEQTLLPGQRIDRFGSEYGAFLAPEGLPYANRSIPPQSLDGTPAEGCNYHDYQVLKPFTVDAGPIAPWFGQPGYGWQYQLDATLLPGGPDRLNVLWLVDNGYLARIS
ncbi:TNT domain-containing protein [Kitasatospora sp. NPDC002227]|uniref:TNT domain-containing protein n=1 Tax=Kitasatospora sp. NPDC002227 TaxID=3154773 RepID=UPI00331A9604